MVILFLMDLKVMELLTIMAKRSGIPSPVIPEVGTKEI